MLLFQKRKVLQQKLLQISQYHKASAFTIAGKLSDVQADSFFVSVNSMMFMETVMNVFLKFSIRHKFRKSRVKSLMQFQA